MTRGEAKLGMVTVSRALHNKLRERAQADGVPLYWLVEHACELLLRSTEPIDFSELKRAAYERKLGELRKRFGLTP